MKKLQDYQNLKTELETIRNNHKEKCMNIKNCYLDPCYISVKMGGDWRFKKQVGCEKNYDGWYFYSASSNSNGYDLYEEIKNACKDFDLLFVSERQL